MKRLKNIVIAFFLVCLAYGQKNDNYPDKLLSSSFKLYQSADFELAYHIFPFLKERFIEQLKDTSSFNNPFDSLAKRIDIKYSSDNLLKTYTWSIRDSGCCHSSVNFAQFKTTAGTIKFIELKEINDGDEKIFITDLQLIQIENKPYYLILGWGTCCGGKHYSTAKVFEIKNEVLQKCDSIFNKEAEIYTGANRGQKIELKYFPELKILSYNSYKLNDDSGFYERKKTVVKWKLTEKGFRKIN